jgi:cytochrome c oxidase assembly protein subunit 15
MNGALVPYDLWSIEPWYHNPFENPVTAQFNHRLIAYLVVVLAAIEAWRRFVSDAASPARNSAALLIAAVLAQASLGIWTLLEAVPLHLGIAHQAFAAVLLVVAVRHLYVASRRV